MDQNKPLALVVDDDPFILMHASDIVAEAGFTPLEATTVQTAIAVLEEHWVDVRVLFTDVQMPATATASLWHERPQSAGQTFGSS